VDTVMKLRVPLKEGKFSTVWVTVSFSRWTLLRGVGQFLTNFMKESKEGWWTTPDECSISVVMFIPSV
jgi:hypothetical protein